MELNIDTGVEEFRVNGRGVLRFNPADPNLYHRFFAAGAELANETFCRKPYIFRFIFFYKANCRLKQRKSVSMKQKTFAA